MGVLMCRPDHCVLIRSFFYAVEKKDLHFYHPYPMLYCEKGIDGMKDRRQSPRIKFTKNKPGFYITLFLERFFFKNREVVCKLRDLSEGGASLLITDEFKKYFSEHSVGKNIRLISENAELSFRL